MFVSSRPSSDLQKVAKPKQPGVLTGKFIIRNMQWNVVAFQESLYHRIETSQDIYEASATIAYLCEKWFITQEIYEWILAKKYFFDGNLDVKPLPAVKQQQIEDCFDWSRYETILNANPGAKRYMN